MKKKKKKNHLYVASCANITKLSLREIHCALINTIFPYNNIMMFFCDSKTRNDSVSMKISWVLNHFNLALTPYFRFNKQFLMFKAYL